MLLIALPQWSLCCVSSEYIDLNIIFVDDC